MISEMLDNYHVAKMQRDKIVMELKLVVRQSEMHAILTSRFEQADREFLSAKRDLNNAVQIVPMAREIMRWVFGKVA